MPRAPRRHGTRSCYQGGCDMPECREAQRTYSREWAALNWRVRHRPEREVDPDKAARHILELSAAGMGYRVIAEACDMKPRQLWAIAHGERTRGIKESTERRILAVEFTLVMIPTVGVARRIQALCALGHTMADIASHTGLDPRTLNAALRQDTVTRRTAADITTAYKVLSMRVGTSEIARRRAADKGWVPPLAWDDETIDDPHATPVGVHEARTEHLDLDEWFRLVRYGEHPERAAERCGVKLGSVEWSARRHNRSEEYVTAMERSRERYAA